MPSIIYLIQNSLKKSNTPVPEPEPEPEEPSTDPTPIEGDNWQAETICVEGNRVSLEYEAQWWKK